MEYETVMKEQSSVLVAAALQSMSHPEGRGAT